MTITLQNTTKVVMLDGIPARIWEGRTASGIEVHAFIVRVAAPAEADTSQFEAELESTAPPSEAVAAYPKALSL